MTEALKVTLFFDGDRVGEADEDDIGLVILHLDEGEKLSEFVSELYDAGYNRRQTIGIYREAQNRIAQRK